MAYLILPQTHPDATVVQRAGAALEGHSSQTERAVKTLWDVMHAKALLSQQDGANLVIPSEPTADLMVCCHNALLQDANLDPQAPGAFSAIQEALLIMMAGLEPAPLPSVNRGASDSNVGQSQEAAERSAHVPRGAAPPRGTETWPIVKLKDGNYKLRVVHQLETKLAVIHAALHGVILQAQEAAQGRPYDAEVSTILGSLSSMAEAALLEFYETPDLPIKIAFLGGNCPVQAEGEIDGAPFYFRARGDSWRLEIRPIDGGPEPTWQYEEGYGSGFDAGWMPSHIALQCLLQAAALYRQGTPTQITRMAPATGFKDLLSRSDE